MNSSIRPVTARILHVVPDARQISSHRGIGPPAPPVEGNFRHHRAEHAELPLRILKSKKSASALVLIVSLRLVSMDRPDQSENPETPRSHAGKTPNSRWTQITTLLWSSLGIMLGVLVGLPALLLTGVWLTSCVHGNVTVYGESLHAVDPDERARFGNRLDLYFDSRNSSLALTQLQPRRDTKWFAPNRVNVSQLLDHEHNKENVGDIFRSTTTIRYQSWMSALLAIVSLAYPVLIATRISERRRRRRRGCCVNCGYDLTGNVSGTCSECGSLAKS